MASAGQIAGHTIRAGYKTPGQIVRLIGILLVFVIIIANGAIALLVLSDLHHANAKVKHALEEVAILKQIDDLTDGSERALAMYHLSLDPIYLATHRDAERHLLKELDRLRGLVSPRSEHSRLLANLTRVVGQHPVEAQTDPIARNSPANGLPQDLTTNRQRSDAIVTALNVMLENEREVLNGYLTTIDLRNTMTVGTVVLGVIGGIVLIGALFLMMRRDARQSAQLAQAYSGALQGSEQRFRRVFEESPLGIVLAHQDNRQIIQANPAFCRMLGYEAEELMGKNIAAITHIDDRTLLLDATIHSRLPDHGAEIRYLTRSGVVAWARVRLTQLGSVGARQDLLLLLTEDITREKRVEAELRQVQKMEAIGLLTGGIAHDFNNLLGIIIGNVEFLIDAVRSNQDHVALANEILNSALSGADLTRRLLAFARRQSLQPRTIDLNAYLPNNVMILRRLLGETIQMTTKLAPDLWITRADPSQIGDALLNLAINSRDAMPYGGQILIETANARLDTDQPGAEVAAGDYVVLSVTDTGTGMSPEVLERVAEPFFTTKEPGAGSGLGLSMIFGFAKQSGGHLKIESELGRGTTVRLFLPRAQYTDTSEMETEVGTLLPAGNEMILLVDDNSGMRTVARRHLISLGYSVIEARNGPDALAILHEGGNFDLLFTDIEMPEGMSGYQLAAAARQLRPKLKVLFTTGYVRSGAGVEWGEASVGAMIRKPYRKRELAATVRAVLEA